MDRYFWASVLIGIVTFAILEMSGVDLWLQDHFYNFQTHTWLVDAKSPLPKLLFYSGPKALIWFVGLLAITAAILYPKLPFLKIPRTDLWIFILTLATAPTIVSLGKATTDTFTPAQIRRYGGDAPYVKVIEHYPKNDHPLKRGRAFPAGHASGGFALFALAGLFATKRGRLIGFSIGLLAGTAMGAYQMFKGAHYLSHTIVTAFTCWIIFLSWRRIFLSRSSCFKLQDLAFNDSPVMRLLIIEDHTSLRESLSQFLREHSFVVDSTGTGNEGLWFASEQPYDVILLDLMLPEMDGMEILARLRKKQVSVFIIVISAKDHLDDRLEALNAGADDYLVKPFSMAEVLARINALIRRKYDVKDPVIQIGDLMLDTVRRTVQRGNHLIELTSLEYRLLEYLAYRQGQVVTRTDIWEHVFEDSSGGNSNIADVYIGYLRKKLNPDDLPNLIHTRRGQGFVIEAN